MNDRAQSDYYSRIPHRVVEALERGALDFHDYALVTFFVAKLDHGKRLVREGRTVPYSLRALAETIGWPLGLEALRRHLHVLRNDGWLDFEVSQGRREVWIFRLSGAAIDGGDDAHG